MLPNSWIIFAIKFIDVNDSIVIIPTYNEIENIEKMIQKVFSLEKDFDLLIIPNKNHGGLYSNTYFIKKRWDYFVKNLLGVEPPKEFSIKK